jgi:hypothetical protein
MQGRDQTVIRLAEKLTAFNGKLELWKRKMEENKIPYCLLVLLF